MDQDVSAAQAALSTALGGAMAAPGEPDRRACRRQAGHMDMRVGTTVCRS